MTRLSRNVAYNVLGQGLVLALGFIGVKFIYGRLGADAFGIIYFNLVLTGVLTTALELGLLSTTVREVSGHFAKDRDYVVRLIRTASLFYWGVGVILMIAVFAAAPFLVDKWVNLKSMDPGTATTMLRFLSVTTLIMLPRALYSSLFQGRQRMELNNTIDVGSSAVQQVGTIAILARGGDAFAAVEWIAASAVLSTLVYMAVASRLFGWRALVPAYFQDVTTRNFRFTAHMGALSVLNMVLIQFDKVLVSKLLPIASVGYYSFASTVVVRISFAASAIGQAALPSFSNLHQLGDWKSLTNQYRKLQDLICFGMVPLFAAAVYAALPIYAYLFNRDTAWVLLLPTALLCIGFYMGATVRIPYTFAVALGRPDIASRANFLALFVVIPVTTALVFMFGLTGAALSWVVYNLFLYAYMIPRICHNALRMDVWSWYGHLARAIVLAGGTYGLLWVLVVMQWSYSTSALAVGYLAASAIFIAGSIFLIGPDLRATIVRFVTRLIVRREPATAQSS
jgi:O-antigen/teichoic acid export membrane protein